MIALLWILLALLVVGVPAGLLWQRQQRVKAGKNRPLVVEARDTVADWPPSATRVLTAPERQAHEILAKALPGHVVLAQVPLSRFIRVPTRYSYGEWLGRVGQLSVDLLVCDKATEVLAVIEVRGAQESPRSLQRHQRLTRVLKAAGVRVLVWSESDLPSTEAVREIFVPKEVESERAALARRQPLGGGPLTTIPVAEVAEGDNDVQREPPPTTWFNDLDGGGPAKAPQPPASPKQGE